jgi:epoxyqueuosine reductase
MQPSIGQNSPVRDPAVAPPGRPDPARLATLAAEIRAWGLELGFQQVGIADTDLGPAEARLADCLRLGFQGEMGFMSRHGTRRSRPAELIPGTLRVISARMDYLPEDQAAVQACLSDPAGAFISRYSLGRDYHKLLRRRLQRLADRIAAAIGPFGYRVFVDSAPVLEKPLAEKAGLGWIGKHTNLINRQAGSWFFLGEVYTDLPLPVDTPAADHCGTCQACLAACPTRAIVAPYVLDARLCISYLTIELKGSIPEPLRPLIGNRIYGCDDCQLACPWNRFARLSREAEFGARWGLDTASLSELFAWDEAQFLQRTEGSAIRRIGHVAWLRNLAVALGNAPTSAAAVTALTARLSHPSDLVREHVRWALERQANPTQGNGGVRPAATDRGSGAAPRWTP